MTASSMAGGMTLGQRNARARSMINATAMTEVRSKMTIKNECMRSIWAKSYFKLSGSLVVIKYKSPVAIIGADGPSHIAGPAGERSRVQDRSLADQSEQFAHVVS